MARPRIDLLTKKNIDILEEHASVNARLARSNFSRLINTARVDKEVVVITDHGEPAAAIVPISDLRILDKLAELKWKDRISTADFSKMSIEDLKTFILSGDKAVTKDGAGAEDVSSDEAEEQRVSAGQRSNQSLELE
jgi:prevent-host-death family protein